jgi:hypothetical protein
MKPEQIEQIKIVDWVKQCTSIPVIHIANERLTSPQQGALLKRMGVLAGASDLFFPRPSKGLHGMWMEVKTLTGKLTLSQIQFLADRESEGYFGIACYGAEEAIDTIKIFYDLK